MAALAALTLSATAARADIAITVTSLEARSISFNLSGEWPEWPATDGFDNPGAIYVWASSSGIVKPYTDFLSDPDWNGVNLDRFGAGSGYIDGTVDGGALPLPAIVTTSVGTGYASIPLYPDGTGVFLGVAIGNSWADYTGKIVDLTVTLDWSANELLNGTAVFDTAWTGTLTFGWGYAGGYLPMDVENAVVILGTAEVGAVPEPAAYAAIVGLAILACAALWRRRRCA
ncbi:hypothetical protein OpiT1DRAFT_05566 [Opitutaceae bacterium TAV1]|nr:hypothetical protein OpiT1DRAFT_05566 [Opitutaceae bacterium TAV1]